MKRTIMLLAIVMFLFVPGIGHALELSLTANHNVYQDPCIETAQSVKLIAEADSGLYVWLTGEAPYIAFGGQEACQAIIIGGGFGFSQPLTKALKFKIDLGYFYAEAKVDHSPTNSTFEEAMMIYTNKEAYPFYAKYIHYEYELEGAPGGSISIEYSKQIMESNWYFNLTTSYRYLKINGTAKGHNGHVNPYWWDIPVERNFSALTGGIGISYRF